MQSKRIKGIGFLAILLVIGLITLSAYLLITISKRENVIAKQREEISKLENEAEYYKNQIDENKDNKDSNIEFEITPGD